MKKLFALLLLTAGLCPLTSALGQQYNWATLVTNRNVSASATSNYNTTIGLQRYEDVALMVYFKMDKADTTNITVTVEQSLDASTWSTINKHSLVAPANGATAVVYVTNLVQNGIGYLRLASLANPSTNGSAVTNIWVAYARKPAANQGR